MTFSKILKNIMNYNYFYRYLFKKYFNICDIINITIKI